MILKIIDFFISKTFLNADYVVENEFKKVSILRILAGIIVFFRFYEIFASHFLIYGFNRISVIFLIALFAILLFTIGFLTPIINILLIIGLPLLDSILSTKTLGTTILINLLVIFLLTNSGRYFSIDNLLLKKSTFFSKLLFKSYTFIGIPNSLGIRRAYFLGFILYAISSLFALFLHIQDPYWIEGVTIKSMLSNSFLCKYALNFRYLEFLFPKIFDIVSIVGVVLQSVFQILMIPLVFFKAGKKYIKIWGFIFFTISLFFLSLSYLPHIELILWIVIFCPLQSATKRIKILFDDKCNFCNKAIFLLRLTNINNIYDFLPISKNSAIYESYSLSEIEIKTYMAGFYEEQLLKGYDLYMVIVKKNPLFFFLFPLFWLGKITGIGEYLYKLIAQNRYRLLGTCELQFNNELKSKNHISTVNIKNDTHFIKFIYSFYFMCVCGFIVVNNSRYYRIFGSRDSVVSFKESYIAFCKNIGIEAPQVFNNVDLSMGDNFMTIKKFKNNKWELIPYTGINGERLNYLNFDVLLFTNYNSDLLYFGNSLMYRRMLISQINNVEEFHKNGYGKDEIDFWLKYDYIKTKEIGNVKYRIEVFTSKSSKVKLFEYDSKRHNLKKIFERIIVFNKQTY
jgi:predicted DCC family thiol-disulfide oxidoreductase YuxK